MRNHRLKTFFLACLLANLTTAFSLQGGEITVLGRILPGYTRAVYVRGSNAYIDAGRSIMTLDVSDPNNTRQAGLLTLPFVSSSGIQNIQAQEDYLYVAYGTGGMQILDISDISNPFVVGNFESFIMGLFVRGQYAYLTSIRRTLIVDISTPSSPALVGSFECHDACFGNSISVLGNYAYVTYATLGGFNGMRVIDVSDPGNPMLAGQLPTQEAYGVSVQGNYAYIANGLAGLRVVDVSDPANPISVAQRAQEPALNIFATGNLVYVTNYSNMKIIDVSDPINPVELSSFRTSAIPRKVFTQGDHAYLADDGGLNVFDVSMPTMPVLDDFFATSSAALDIAVRGEHAYIADAYPGGGLHIVNISEVESPRQVGMQPSPSSRRVVLRDNMAYLTSHDSGLIILDVSDANNPILLGTLDGADFSPGAIVVEGNYAYIASDSPPSLQIVDIEDPSEPRRVGSILVGRAANDVSVDGSYAYVAAGIDGLKIIDISNPSEPSEVAAFVMDSSQGVYVEGNYAYLANGYRDIYSDFSGLRILDISDPGQPKLVGAYHIGGRPSSVLVSGTHAYVGNYDPRFGLKIINITDPIQPREVGAFAMTHSPTERVYVSNDRIYLANASEGVYILRFDAR